MSIKYSKFAIFQELFRRLRWLTRVCRLSRMLLELRICRERYKIAAKEWMNLASLIVNSYFVLFL